jgi:Uma2 family endonuclease
MKGSQAMEQPSNTLIDDVERYEVIDGVRVEREPIGAFETMLASWLCYLINAFAAGKKMGRAVNEMLFTLDVHRNLKRRPDVAFVSYPRWPTPRVAREAAWDAIPDLAVEIVSPTNLAEEIDGKVTDYFQAHVRQVWVVYPDSGRVYVYLSPTQVTVLERTDTLDGGEVLPGFRLPIEQLYEDVIKPE